ncbi:hypothetical protein GGR56DRAFT_671712 [Xylariaceae sp. FL0804]|nr:hypothetical protein GGR56DRAFT_671712 [Xylariaceae sp. FL0804]
MAPKAMIPFLVAMMLLTGVCNTLLTKLQDNQCVRDCDTKRPKLFEQPVLQTAQMFVGESGCWIVVGLIAAYNRLKARRSASGEGGGGYQPVRTNEADADADADAASVHSDSPLNGSSSRATPAAKKRAASRRRRSRGVLDGFGILLLSLPAVCDICGTTLMNAGLLMVAASIYQMTRGALVLFVGLFSVVFLRRRLHLYQWVSLVGVVLGVALVGLAGAISPDETRGSNSNNENHVDGSGGGGGGDPAVVGPEEEAVRVVLGVLLIAGAQIFTATQFVLEEFLLERSSIEPLEVVGWEGLFGLAVTLVAMLILHFAVGRTDAGRYGMFDMVEGFRQMTEYKTVLISSFLIMISIGGFNFFGLSVTRSVSATARSTIDTCRTLFIWIVSLGLGWETFKWLQVAGFALLVYFTFVFNGIVPPPLKFLRVREEEEDDAPATPLLPEEPIEHN